MFARVFGSGVMVVAAIAVMSASTAASAKPYRGSAIDVSTRAGIVAYLRSVHIDPRGVAIERGVRNYAGAGCPGRRWMCTPATHAVVQVAAAGGSNTFRCSAARCAVVQISNQRASGTNTATCIKTKGLTQVCKISQVSASANNRAGVYERVRNSKGVARSSGSSFSVTQVAKLSVSITQKATGARNSNQACVYQTVSLDRSGTIKKPSVTLSQTANQTVTVKQDSAHGGNSAAMSATPHGACTGSAITQLQTLNSKLTAPKLITQKQNSGTKGANLTTDIEQNQSAGFLGSAKGTNSADFNQYSSLTAVANSPAGPVTQTQSALVGGLLRTVNQDSRDPSTVVTAQTGIQCVNAAKSGLTNCRTHAVGPSSVTQRQAGVVHKGVGRAEQTGNPADTFKATQSSTQANNPGPHTGQTNTVQGDCSTAGSCTVTQHTNINGQQSSNTKSGQNVNTVTGCTGGSCSVLTLAHDITAHGAGGQMETFDLTSGQLLNSFVPDGDTGTAAGTGVAVGGNELFYTNRANGNGASDAIHVTPFNNGAGGHDTRTIPNPDPANGLDALDYANGSLYALDVPGLGQPSVWKLNPANGAVTGGPTTLSSPSVGSEFVVLPNGNFLSSSGDCSYAEYSHVTGNPTGLVINLPASLLSCDGVATDGTSLYFNVLNGDGSESVIWTGLDGTYFANLPHVDSGDALNDISIP